MNGRKGRVEVIFGCMFCGKTEEMIRRLTRVTIAKQQFQAFKINIDDRDDPEIIKAHSDISVPATTVSCSSEILEFIKPETTVVAIDEAQFFDDFIVEVIENLADSGYRVIVTGLPTDFRGEPFGCMPIIIAKADEVTHLDAICQVCGESATRTQRLIDGKPASYNSPVILIGAEDLYKARCRRHHDVPRE